MFKSIPDNVKVSTAKMRDLAAGLFVACGKDLNPDLKRMAALEVLLQFAEKFQVPMNVPEDIEQLRKRFVFAGLYRTRIKIQKITLKQVWIKGKPTQLVEAEYGIDTLYAGYGHDRLIEEGSLHIGSVLLRDGHKTSVMVDNATKDFVSIYLKGIGTKGCPVRKIGKFLIQDFYLIEHINAQFGVAFVYRDTEGLKSLNGKIAGLSEENLAKWLEEGSAYHYVYFINSPSGMRQGILPDMCVPFAHEKHWVKWVEDRINTATGGMYYVEKEANGGEKKPISKGIKLNGRQALGITPSTYLGQISNMAFYFGDFTVSVAKEGEPNYTIVPGDGRGYVSIQAIKRTVKERFGIEISAEDAIKFGGQHRINSFVKGHNLIIDEQSILAKIHWMLKTGMIKKIIRLPRTRRAGILFSKKQKEWAGCLVIFGDLEHVEYFGDLTCAKCSTDFSKPMELRLMDISHTPHGYIPLSKQGIIQMQLTGKHFENMYHEVGPDTLDKWFNQTKFDDVDDGIETTEMNASEDAYTATMIQRLAPQAMQCDMHIKRIVLQSVVDTLNNRLNRCNLIVGGKYLKLVPDIGSAFGAMLLQDGEFYSPNWKVEDDGTGFDAVIIRYPLVDFGAFIKGKYVSYAEMKRRIMALDLPYCYKKSLLSDLKSITSAMIMIASMVPGTTNKLSGADFDGDGACCFTDSRIKNVYKYIRSYANDFGGSVAGDLMVEFDYFLGPISFMYAWALNGSGEPNPAIGVIAGFNVTVSTLLADVMYDRRTPDKVFHYFLDQEEMDDQGNIHIVPAKPGKYDYYRCFTADKSNDIGVDVSFVGKEHTYVEEILNAAHNCNWTKESCIRFLWDLNAVLSKSMNDTIDAAKNGAKVLVPFLERIQERVRSSAVRTTDYAEIELSRSELAIKSYTDVCGSKESLAEQEKGINILKDDPIATMKRYILALAWERLQEAMAEPIESDLEEISGGKKIDSSIRRLAEFYKDLMKSDGNNKAAAKKMVVSMVYALLRKNGITDPEQILGIVYRASAYQKGSVHAHTSFYTAFVELVQHYVVKFCKDMRFETRVYKFNGGTAYIGQQVTFVNGISADGFYVDQKLDGTFSLEMDSKFRPIISRPVLDMIPQKEGNQKFAMLRLWKQSFKEIDPETGKVIKTIDMDPSFDPIQRISKIEKLRLMDNLKCSVRVIDPKTLKIVSDPISKIELKKHVIALTSNHGALGYIQIPEGNSAYLEAIRDKVFVIRNVMTMGKGMVTVGVGLEEIG